MQRRVIFSIIAALAVATAVDTAEADDLVWQLGVRDGSRNEFAGITGRWDPWRGMWIPVPCEGISADRLTFLTKLDHLGVFPKPTFPIALRSASTMLLKVGNGAQTAIVEWDDPTGGPEELEIVFSYFGGDGRDLRVTLPGDRVRNLDAGAFPDIVCDGSMDWRLVFVAEKGTNRIKVELLLQRSPGYDFDMLRVRRIEKAPPEGVVTPVVMLQAGGNEIAHIYAQGQAPGGKGVFVC